MATSIGYPIENFELSAVGQRMYNDWLADFCSVEPERHVGLAQLPMWDVAESIKELQRVRNSGLRGVNFPQVRAEITPYEDPVWEPFWSACEDLEMPLANHGGGGASTPMVTGPLGLYIYMVESNALSRVSPVVRLVYGGVFERHPNLKLIQTEQLGAWYDHVLHELDSRWEKFWYAFDNLLPRRPSEYCRSNYFVGASFQSHTEAQAAVRDGYVDNILWGSDYPHPEGTYHYQDQGEDPR
jgi:predicted TIM-barrel fold metal-dependent hydrolase